jgi:hypothetical protein
MFRFRPLFPIRTQKEHSVPYLHSFAGKEIPPAANNFRSSLRASLRAARREVATVDGNLEAVSGPARLQLRVPEACVECGVKGVVRFESTIHGESVILTWCCAACSHQWPATHDDHQQSERRVGLKERRHLTRTDRRRKR